MTTLKTIF